MSVSITVCIGQKPGIKEGRTNVVEYPTDPSKTSFLPYVRMLVTTNKPNISSVFRSPETIGRDRLILCMNYEWW